MSDAAQATIKHRPTPAALRSSVTSRDGAPIGFTREGAGPPLVLVDGAFCHRGMGPSSPLAALLAGSYTVFTYDRRGRGESGDNPPYAVERELEDLQALIEEAGGSAHVWGISSGAALALEAARRGAGITKLALYEPPFIVDDSRSPIPADIASQLSDLVAADRRDAAVRLFLRHMGAPRLVIALMRLLPVWPKLRRVARTLPYDMTIVSPYQRDGAADESMGRRRRSDACDGRRQEPSLAPPQRASARRGPSRGIPPRRRRPDAQREGKVARRAPQ
jgi:pimeloyl-ACP methyl ester carboxylesterase